MCMPVSAVHAPFVMRSHPIGGMACVGIRSLSFANIAESERRPFALLMSATCTEHDASTAFQPHQKSANTAQPQTASDDSRQKLTETPYLMARPAMVSSFVTCRKEMYHRQQ